MRDFDLQFTESRSLGATWALDVLWNRLGIGETMRRVLADRHLDDSAERVLFALIFAGLAEAVKKRVQRVVLAVSC